jgi:hypothetical protein
MINSRFPCSSIFIESLVDGAQIPDLSSPTSRVTTSWTRFIWLRAGSCKHENEPSKGGDVYWLAEGLWFTEWIQTSPIIKCYTTGSSNLSLWKVINRNIRGILTHRDRPFKPCLNFADSRHSDAKTCTEMKLTCQLRNRPHKNKQKHNWYLLIVGPCHSSGS